MSAARRILVVDDVEQNLALLGGLVRTLGYEVETARDGRERQTSAANDFWGGL